MGSGKRASMREGPLAALFRKTEEVQEHVARSESGRTESPSGGAPAPPPPATEAARAAASEPVQQRLDVTPPEASAPEPPRAPEPARAPEAPPSPEPARAAETVPAPEPMAAPAADAFDPRVREAPYPHPSLGARPEPQGHDPEPEPRTPQERLRDAFSSELPEDVMASPRTPPRTPAPSPVHEDLMPPAMPAHHDPYARSGASGWGAAADRVVEPVIRVVGVGGAGVNAVNRMVEAEVAGVEFIAVNTDVQSLQQSTADVTLHIGPQITRGLGAGSDPELGRRSAQEDLDKIKSLLKGSDMVFVAAGAGGGTGTGAAPIVARLARDIGALTVGIVTKPFGFEGSRRMSAADAGVDALAEEVDTLIVVPNNRLLTVLDKHTSMVDAFRVADDVLRQGVQGISDLVTLPGLINLDFADVRTIMSEAGNALLGIGMGDGEHRAVEAAKQAVSSPLLETSMDGARKILLSITAGSDLSLWEVNEAAKAVAEAAHPEANIIFGAMVDEKLADQVWVTVVATGFNGASGPTRDRDRERERERPAARRGAFEEPAGEPRVERRTAPREERARPRPREERPREERPREERKGPLRMSELDVPEFIPRG